MALTAQMLANAELDLQTLADVINGGATSVPVLNRAGNSIKTLQRLLAEMQAEFDGTLLNMDLQFEAVLAQHGYEPPVAYAAGLNIDRVSQTVYQGDFVYAPIPSAVPFVTGAVLNAAQWYQLPRSQTTVGLAGLKNIAAIDGQSIYMLDIRRFGIFEFYSAARIAAVFGGTFATWKARDPGEGFFVPPAADATGASGMWVRQTKELWPRHFGAGETADDTTMLRRIVHLASFLKLPCWSDKSQDYPVGEVDPLDIRLGTLDNTAVAIGQLDKLRMLGDWNFRCKADLRTVLVIRGGTDLEFGNVNFDIKTEATNGQGKLEFQACYHIEGGAVRKINDEANIHATGGSAVGLHNATEFVHFKEVIVKHVSPQASAVFVVGANAFFFDRVIEVGGQDALDISGVSPLTAGRAYWGCDFLYGEGCDEVLDCGNASGGHIKRLVAKNVTDVLNIKTELSGVESLGSNNVKIDRIDVDGWTGFLVGMQGGSSSGLPEAQRQTLHNLEIGSIDAKTTVATAATRAFRLLGGDKLTDPTHGFKVGRALIDANEGTTIEMPGMLDFSFENVTSNMPSAMLNAIANSFARQRMNGLFKKCKLNGDFVARLKGVTFEDVEIAGRFGITDGVNNKYVRSGSRNSQTLGMDLQFNTPGNKNVDIENCYAINVGIGGAASQWALSIWKNGATIAVSGIRIRGFHMEDNQRSLAITSGGVVVPLVGQLVVGAVSAATGIINKITPGGGGTWAGGDQAATLLLRDVTGEFQAAEALKLYDPDSSHADSLLSADFGTAGGASVAAPTSGGLRLGASMIPDFCVCEGITSVGIPDANHSSHGWQGASSINDPMNRIKASPLRQRATATTLAMQDIFGTLQMTANAEIRLDNNGNVFPVKTRFKLQNRSASPAVTVAGLNGAVIQSRGGLLSIPVGGEAELEILSHAPLTAQLTGDLA